jgi:hypothetical protein
MAINEFQPADFAQKNLDNLQKVLAKSTFSVVK